MSKPRDDEDQRIEREIRARHRVDPTRILVGRDGGGHLKGASPTPLLQQVLLEVTHWLRRNLDDTEQALTTVILRRLAARPELLEANQGQPARILGLWADGVLAHEANLTELVREVDMAWGQANAERPLFQVDGQPADPDDPYTIEGVRRTLNRLRAAQP